MTQEQDGPFTEEDEHPVSEFDNEPKDVARAGIEWPADGTMSPPITGDGAGEALPDMPASAYPPGAKPLSPAAPYAEPPLFAPVETVSVRVDADGYATVNGQRVFVARSLAGATVNVPKAWGQ